MEKRDYRTSVYIGVINGKPKRKTLRANSQKELDEKVADLKRSIENGKNAYDKAIFSTWAKKWYDEDKVPSGIKKNTLGQITGAIDKLNGYFGNTEYTDLENFYKFNLPDNFKQKLENEYRLLVA